MPVREEPDGRDLPDVITNRIIKLMRRTETSSSRVFEKRVSYWTAEAPCSN